MVERQIVVTGAYGFVGSALLDRLSAGSWLTRPVVRQSIHGMPRAVVVGDINQTTEWEAVLSGADCVIHLAARVHLMADRSEDPLEEYRKVNVAGTLHLARSAAQSGVKRFVFLSSIKVNGEVTYPGSPFTANDLPAPVDPYGISKFEAEQGLLALAEEIGMEVVIIRPVLVYGPGVKANFLGMLRWLHRGVPLPLAAIHNRRSLVALGNLVDLIITCIDHPAAANQTFLVSDGVDLSTSELLRRLGEALGRPARLLPVPPALLEAGATLIGRKDIARRLCGSLQVDIGKTRELLGWSPPVSVDEGLRKTARAYLEAPW